MKSSPLLPVKNNWHSHGYLPTIIGIVTITVSTIVVILVVFK